jgi:hypothetical protein
MKLGIPWVAITKQNNTQLLVNQANQPTAIKMQTVPLEASCPMAAPTASAVLEFNDSRTQTQTLPITMLQLDPH